MPVLLFYSFLLSLTLIQLLWKAFIRSPSRLPLPPGPKPLPFIGNILEQPTEKPWLTYDQWCKQYGDIVHVDVLGQPIIILGSKKRAFDLFEKRSSIYSDRARLPMLNELSGWRFKFAFMPYGDWWRQHRRLFHAYFHPNVVGKYQSIQRRESKAFLRRLLHSPSDFMYHIRHTFAATIMDVTYGIQVGGSDDSYVTIAEEAFKSLREASVPGTFLVDLFPILSTSHSGFLERLSNAKRHTGKR
ncbi:hypothetical protein HGRIS_014290 [Hohenbuehelia grisea]|uniref:Cytochrome P450 n=1 Tax=Hohenbuehelia grisea TaxID=104357 RepID=A0ABR3JT79_9AGAR